MLENKKDAADLVRVEISQAKLVIADLKADLQRDKQALDEHLESRRLDVNPVNKELLLSGKDLLEKVQTRIATCVKFSKELGDATNGLASELEKRKKEFKTLPRTKTSEAADMIKRIQDKITFNRGMVCTIKNVQLRLVPFAAWLSEGIKKI